MVVRIFAPTDDWLTLFQVNCFPFLVSPLSHHRWWCVVSGGGAEPRMWCVLALCMRGGCTVLYSSAVAADELMMSQKYDEV